MEQQEKTEQALSAKKIKEMKKAEKRKQKEAKKEQKAKNPGKKRKKAPVIIAAIIIVLIVIRMVSCAFSGNAGVMVSTTNACGSRRCRQGRRCPDDLRHGSDGAAPAGGVLTAG